MNDLVVIAVTLAVAAGIQVTMGFGFALVAIPIIAVAEDPKVAVVLITAVGVPMTLWNTYRWRRHLRVREMLTVAGASLVAGLPHFAPDIHPQVRETLHDHAHLRRSKELRVALGQSLGQLLRGQSSCVDVLEQ